MGEIIKTFLPGIIFCGLPIIILLIKIYRNVRIARYERYQTNNILMYISGDLNKTNRFVMDEFLVSDYKKYLDFQSKLIENVNKLVKDKNYNNSTINCDNLVE